MYWDDSLPVDAYRISKAAGICVISHTFGDEKLCETGLLNGQRAIMISMRLHHEDPARARFEVANALVHALTNPDASRHRIIRHRPTSSDIARHQNNNAEAKSGRTKSKPRN